MTPKKFTHKQMKKRFEKISNHIIQSKSPSADKGGNPMAVEDESDAEDQEGKKTKYRSIDPTDESFM